MLSTLLGQTELSVGRLGFGAAPIGFLKTPQGQVDKLVALLLDERVNLLDTAAMYLDAEEKLGIALAGRRDEPDDCVRRKAGSEDFRAWGRPRRHPSSDRVREGTLPRTRPHPVADH